MTSVLYRAVREVAGARADAVAVTGPDGAVLTYPELVDRVDVLASGLAGRGVGAGDTVAFALRTSADYVALILAVAALGARYCPLMSDFTAEETERAVARTGPVLLVADRPHLAELPAVAPVQLAKAAGRPAPRPSAPHAGIFRLLWTSGSTGFPKTMAWRQDKLVSERRRWIADTGLGPSDVFLCRHPLDVAHATDLHVFAALLSGARLVLMDPSSSPDAILDQLERTGATVMSALPAHYEDLVAAVAGRPKPSLSRLRRPLCGGAYLSAALIRRSSERLGVNIRQIYGSTEFGLALGNMDDTPQTDLRLRPVAGVAARVEPLGPQTPALGELVLRSDFTSEGYLDADKANARTFRAGEFWTGDVAELGADGSLRILGRLSEALRGAAGPVLAPMLDDELAERLPGTEAVTLPVAPGAYSDRLVVAVRSAREPEARTQIKAVLAAHGLAGDLRFVDAIPRTPVGKVDKPRLRALCGLEGGR